MNFFVPRIEAANRGLGTTGHKGERGRRRRGMVRGYLVSRIIKAGDPLGFVYVAEGPGRGWMERRKERKERRKKGRRGEARRRRKRHTDGGGREENREIKAGEEERNKKKKKRERKKEKGEKKNNEK